MLRKLYAIGLLCLLPTWLGCAMCCGTDDYNYGAYGGRWERHDMSHGRVGSLFADAGMDTLIEDEVDEPIPGDDGIASTDASETELATFIR